MNQRQRDTISRKFYESRLTKEQANRVMSAKNRETRHKIYLKMIQKECQYCGSRNELTIDHIVPVSVTGQKRNKNLANKQVLCRTCNQSKGSRIML